MLILYTVAPLLYRLASSAYFNLSLLSSDFYGLLFGIFWPFVFCSLIDYFFPLPGLFLYVGSCTTIIPAIVSTDAILSIALHTILAILHRVLRHYFGSNHVLLVLCASVPLGFLFFFQHLIGLSHAFHSGRTRYPWSQTSTIPWDANERDGTRTQTRCKGWRNEGARSWPESMMSPEYFSSSSWITCTKKEKFTNYSFFCFTVFVSEYSKTS